MQYPVLQDSYGSWNVSRALYLTPVPSKPLLCVTKGEIFLTSDLKSTWVAKCDQHSIYMHPVFPFFLIILMKQSSLRHSDLHHTAHSFQRGLVRFTIQLIYNILLGHYPGDPLRQPCSSSAQRSTPRPRSRSRPGTRAPPRGLAAQTRFPTDHGLGTATTSDSRAPEEALPAARPPADSLRPHTGGRRPSRQRP